jgi:cystathionine gamma-lyase
VHAGLPAPEQGAPFLPGPVFAAPFHLQGEPSDQPFGYHRYANPTWSHWESALGELEGGETASFPSGMAAVTAVLLAFVPPGGVLVAPADAYPGVRQVAEAHLAPIGVDVRLVPSRTESYCDAAEGADLVFVETPSNPLLDIVDLHAVAEAARAAGALLAVDNTLATPLLQRPLELGADLAVTSGSKALTGHADLVLGHVATRDPGQLARLLELRGRIGSILGPFEAWLAHRSLATLSVRLERQCANALALAQMLERREDVQDVRHPALPGHPGHELAMRQMSGRGGPLLGFALPDGPSAQRFLAGAELVLEATSFGGVHTTAERRLRWCTGIEDTEDLLEDVARALDAATMRVSA